MMSRLAWSCLGAALGLPASVSAQTIITVWPGNPQGWQAVQETPTGGFAFVNGPGTPPLGKGSASFVVDGTGGIALATRQFLGKRLADITALSYSTYRALGAPALAVSLQFNIDPDVTDNATNWFGRLVFEPYYTETVQTGVWETWDTMTQGRWWFTGPPGNAVCPISNPCTWNQILTYYPNIGIHATLGAVILKAGSGWAGGFAGNADALTIGILGQNTTFDFELGPTNKDECKNGGWIGFFPNQGLCVSWFVSNRP